MDLTHSTNPPDAATAPPLPYRVANCRGELIGLIHLSRIRRAVPRKHHERAARRPFRNLRSRSGRDRRRPCSGEGRRLCGGEGEAREGEAPSVGPRGLGRAVEFSRPAACRQGSTKMSGGRSPRQKGDRAERALVRVIQDGGLAAERVPLSGAARGKYCGDLTVPILGRDRIVEVKVRARGFSQLYAWLEGRDLLVARADRREPLVVLTHQTGD